MVMLFAALQATKAASKDLDLGFQVNQIYSSSSCKLSKSSGLQHLFSTNKSTHKFSLLKFWECLCWQIGRLVDEAAANADDASSRLHAAAAARDRAARARAPVTPATTATDYTHTSDSDFDEEPSLAATQAVVPVEPTGAGNTSPSQLSLFNMRNAARAERAAAAAQEGQPTDMAAAAAALGAAAVAAVAAAPGQFVEAASARVQGGMCCFYCHTCFTGLPAAIESTFAHCGCYL